MKLTVIYQSDLFEEREWIPDIFREVVSEQIFDGKHQCALDNCLLVDFFLHRWPREYYDQFRGMNAWLFHIADEAYDGGYDYYENFQGVFRNHWSGIFNPKRILQLPLGYTAGLSVNPHAIKASGRKYLWSFMGQACKSSRPEMTRAFLPLTPHFVLVTDQGNPHSLKKQEYYQILHNSTFVPCPMGNVHLESFRTYEAIECGAIPILERRLGFDYYANLLGKHPLPTFSTWKRAARFVETIKGDTPALNRLQGECAEWWNCKKQNLRKRIATFVRTAPGKEEGPYSSWRGSLPGWQAVELLRHHSGPAVARRVFSQVHRMVTKGKLRA
jgi:hypothetical protein